MFCICQTEYNENGHVKSETIIDIIIQKEFDAKVVKYSALQNNTIYTNTDLQTLAVGQYLVKVDSVPSNQNRIDLIEKHATPSWYSFSQSYGTKLVKSWRLIKTDLPPGLAVFGYEIIHDIDGETDSETDSETDGYTDSETDSTISSEMSVDDISPGETVEIEYESTEELENDTESTETTASIVLASDSDSSDSDDSSSNTDSTIKCASSERNLYSPVESVSYSTDGDVDNNEYEADFKLEPSDIARLNALSILETILHAPNIEPRSKISEFDLNSMAKHPSCIIVESTSATLADATDAKNSIINNLLSHMYIDKLIEFDYVSSIPSILVLCSEQRTSFYKSYAIKNAIHTMSVVSTLTTDILIDFIKERKSGSSAILVIDGIDYSRYACQMRTIMCNARSLRTSVIMVIRDPSKISPEIRYNFNYAIAMREPLIGPQQKLYRAFGSAFRTPEQFENYFNDITSDTLVLEPDGTDTVQSNAMVICQTAKGGISDKIYSMAI